MKKFIDFTGKTETISGVQTKDIKYNSAVGFYLGKVWDEKSYLPDKWTTCTWKVNGKCVNRHRPELDLK